METQVKETIERKALKSMWVLRLTKFISSWSSAHSTAYSWGSAAAFYFGGALYYNEQNVLEYNAGRNNGSAESRAPCIEDPETGNCESTQNVITNSKVYQVGNVGIGMSLCFVVLVILILMALALITRVFLF